MAYVNPSTQSLKTCFQSRYSLPYFQREYKWEARHYTELLNDIQSAFLLDYEPQHGRKHVAGYSPYFLGSIITSTEKDGKKPLIDGQQRLTSMFLLVAFLERYRRDNSVQDALDLSTYLGSVQFGEMDYSIEFSDTRKAIFDRYLNMSESVGDALISAEDVTNADGGDKKILEALRLTESLLDKKVVGAIAYFIDYVVERVLLIDISVASEAEAHRVFVTMNDRGLRLGPIDLLKGHILSKITDLDDSRNAHHAWMATVNSLKIDDPEEDSLFFRDLFRAKWAVSIRGKSKGDPAGDFDIIGEAYHRWFEVNANSRIGISNADGYTAFARELIPQYAAIYRFIKSVETTLTSSFEALYYNASRKYSFHRMVLLASVDANDTTEIRDKKLVLVARLLDVLLTARTIEGKENNYENLRDISFALAKDIRGKDYPSLLTFVQGEWPKYEPVIPSVQSMKYAKSGRSDILYILARIGCFIETECAITNRVGFATYWQRDKAGKTFDIEHLLKDAFDASALPPTHGFTDAKDYADSRNLLGALALLPRSRNRSLQDKAYRDKLNAYSTENVLAGSLTGQFYQNNPNVASFLSRYPTVTLKDISDFGKSDLSARGAVYAEIAKEIWKKP